MFDHGQIAAATYTLLSFFLKRDAVWQLGQNGSGVIFQYSQPIHIYTHSTIHNVWSQIPPSQPCRDHTVESFDINYKPSLQSKACLEKVETLSAFKTRSPFQPCQSPRQTSPSGFCCRSFRWERTISYTWRGGRIDQLTEVWGQDT